MSVFLRPLVLVASAALLLSQQPPRAKWIDNGLIDAGGTHEPYLFQVRRGGQRLDARQQLDAAQSEATLRRLKEQGIEVFHTHLYKGFGMAAEKPEMEETRRVAEIAHRLGLKVDTYIQWNTLMYETFFAEEPRAQDWIQRDASGRPIMLVYGFQQSFRYRPCFRNRKYLDYLKKIVRYAVEEVKTDFIHFDNFDLNPEPESCHDRACTLGFREYLKTKFTPNERRDRFGFDNVDFVNPPEWNNENAPGDMQVILDPVIQEWIEFRCQVMADALRDVALYAKSLNPEVVIEINPHGINGANRAWEAAIDHSRILKWTEAFWTEVDPNPRYTSDGRLLSRIRSYKLARAYRNVLMSHTAGNPVALAESLAFNQTVGYAGEDPLKPATLHYLAFYRRNRDLFTGSQDVATVALLRSHPSITYNQPQVQLSTVLVEQALIENRIPFDLVFDEHLADLSKYKALVLPDTECLSDAQLDSIRGFVARGGGLVATEQAGLYDQWRRLRVEPGLIELKGAPVRKTYREGRTVYIPAVRFPGPLPEFTKFFPVDERFWKLPANAQEIADAVRWAARDDLPVHVAGPAYLVSNLVAQPDKHRMMLHLINYNARRVPSIDPVPVVLRLPKAQTAKTVRLYSPDAEAPRALDMKTAASSVTFAVPVKTYSIAVVTW